MQGFKHKTQLVYYLQSKNFPEFQIPFYLIAAFNILCSNTHAYYITSSHIPLLHKKPSRFSFCDKAVNRFGDALNNNSYQSHICNRCQKEESFDQKSGQDRIIPLTSPFPKEAQNIADVPGHPRKQVSNLKVCITLLTAKHAATTIRLGFSLFAANSTYQKFS